MTDQYEDDDELFLMNSGTTTTIAMSAPDTAMITVLTMMANWSATARIARTDPDGGTSSKLKIGR